MVRLNPIQAACAVLALVALGLAACSKNNSTPSSNPTPTPTPTATSSAAATGCTVPTSGIAYVPDGGNGGAFRGVQVVHFVDTSGNLCAAATVQNVGFPGAVEAFVIASDGTAAIATMSSTGAPPYTLVQDVFGASIGAIVPVGSAYDVSQVPTPTPSTTPTTVPSPTPVLADLNSAAVLGSSSAAIGLVAGAGTGFMGLTSLTAAPPQFGGFVAFRGQTLDPGNGNRPGLVLSADGSVALLRGPNDLLSYQVSIIAVGYQFTIKAQDTGLGWGSAFNLRGFPAMEISPADASRAIVLQAPSANSVTLITGLPGGITRSSTLPLPSRPHSVAIASGGTIAVIGADNGFYVVKGVDTGSLSLVAPFAPNPSDSSANAPTFPGCSGTFRMTNVASVDFSFDQRFLIVVGNPPGQSCAGGNNASLIALPFNTATGVQPTPSPVPTPVSTAVPSPGPTMFTANGLVTRPTDMDNVIVR